MKKHLTTSLTVLIFSISVTANAQFLDRLGKKVTDRVENTIINKTTDKAGKETGKVMDEALESDGGKKKKGAKKNTSKTETTPQKTNSKSSLNSSYDFSYQYQMTMKTSEGNMVMDYFIQPKETYMGAKMSLQGMEQFMIFENNNIHTFMDMNGMKITQTINSLDFTQDVDYDENNYKVSEIPGKTILGYPCKGMKMENDQYEFKIYYTNDAPFGMTNFMNSNQMYPKMASKAFNENTLMMEVEMKDKKNNKNNAKMECTLVKENKYSFSTAGYTSM